METQYVPPAPDYSWITRALELLESGRATPAELCMAMQMEDDDE